MQEFEEFARALWKHARLLITGSGLTAVLTLWAWISGRSVAKTTGLGVGIVLILWAFYLPWRDEHRARLKAESAVEKARQRPTLNIVFAGDVKPFLEEQPIHTLGKVGKDRRYRVGLSSNAKVTDACLVLESCEPDDVGVHPGHAFQVMESATKIFDINPGDVPSVFVDIVRQEIRCETSKGAVLETALNRFFLCYAAQISSEISAKRHVLTLRVEGGETSCRKSFIVDKDPNTSKLLMQELNF